MENSQKGFIVTFLLAIIVVLIICGGAYSYYSHNEPSTTFTQPVSEGCEIQPYKGNEKPAYDISGYQDVRGGVICNFYIAKDLPLYTFHLIADLKFDTIKSIEVTEENKNGVIQTLSTTAEEPAYTLDSLFNVEDANFDGYKDIKLSSWSGATGNRGYNYWLFDPIKNMFVFNKDLSELSNPNPDPKTKTISTHNNGGAVGCIYDDEIYKFDENGKLILVHKEEQVWADDNVSFNRTTSDLLNGKMVTTTKTVICPNY